MLITTLKPGQSIVLRTPQGDVTVMLAAVCRYCGRQVKARLAFDAPRSVPIMREELLEAMERVAGDEATHAGTPGELPRPGLAR